MRIRETMTLSQISPVNHAVSIFCISRSIYYYCLRIYFIYFVFVASCSGTRRLAKRHALDESGPNTQAYKRERVSVLPRDENAWIIDNSTNPDGYIYHSLNGKDAQQQLEEASPMMGTYSTSAHENVLLPYGTGRVRAATMHNIPHQSEMNMQHISQTPMPSRNQISGPSKAETTFLQDFRTHMRMHKSPEVTIVNWPPSTSPLNLTLNNVVPTPAISNGGMWTGVDNLGATQTRIEVISLKDVAFNESVIDFFHFNSIGCPKLAFEYST